MTAASSDAVAIRPACAADGAGIGRVQAESWQSTYAGILPDTVLLRMTPDRQARLWQRYLRDYRSPMGAIYVAERAAIGGASGIVGFGSCGPEQSGALDFDGEVYTLYVDDALHGQGLGRRLLQAMFARLRQDGRRSVVIWVLADNPSRFFYEALGGTLVAERRSRQWGVMIAERAYGWRDLGALD
jgi:ribosomal protein S18 acetylase RimI-like enzyme